jgi:hypothetical protein
MTGNTCFDDGFTKDFYNKVYSFDDQVHKAGKKRLGVLFYILVEHNLNTDDRQIKIFNPMATGFDFKSTLLDCFVLSPDELMPGPHTGVESISGYAFAYVDKDGQIKRAIAKDDFIKATRDEALSKRDELAFKAERLKEQTGVLAREQADWENHLDRLEKQRAIEGLHQFWQGVYNNMNSQLAATPKPQKKLGGGECAGRYRHKPIGVARARRPLPTCSLFDERCNRAIKTTTSRSGPCLQYPSFLFCSSHEAKYCHHWCGSAVCPGLLSMHKGSSHAIFSNSP